MSVQHVRPWSAHHLPTGVRHDDRVDPVVVAEVSKRYYRRGPLVLDGVRLELPPGSVTQLKGSNGSGKSTLLRLLAGVTAATSGQVHGRPPVVGYVPERFPSDLRFTPREYLGWLGRIRGLAPAEVTRRAEGLSDQLGLQPVARDQPMRDLSKGTTQKVAVIQALLDAPALLLLDEAWTGLDADAQAVLSDLVVRRRAEGSVVVFADHGRRAVGVAPDATYLVDDGRLTSLDVARERPAGGVRVELLAQDGSIVAHVVDPDQVDRFLVTAIEAGWSVVSVGAR
jgi:ABC-2 type transport system ATP-binding protein